MYGHKQKPSVLDLLERIRAAGAEAMGVTGSQNVPKVAFIAEPKPYRYACGALLTPREECN